MNLPNVSREELIALYYGEKLNYRDMGLRLGYSAAAVCKRMKEEHLIARKVHDYPPTEKAKAAWVKNGKRLGKVRTTEERRASGHKNKGFRWKDYEFGGHEKIRTDGYVTVFVPDHPYATKDGYVAKHRLIMEREIGRYLTDDEVVHHINHKRDDNRLENLQLMTKSEHMSMHMKERHQKRREKNESQ